MTDDIKANTKLFTRRRGILLPIFSLPSKYGVGTLGRAAYDFIDILSANGASIWAILPTGVTGYGDSPYQSFSSFALNPYFLDLDMLIEEGLLTEDECAGCDMGDNDEACDYGKLYRNRLPLLMTAYARATQREEYETDMKRFDEASPWLDDYAVFMAIKDKLGGKPWYEWDEGLKNRDADAIEKIRESIQCEVMFHKFIQMKLAEQWSKLSEYALKKGVLIMGDMPIYCAYDSADCWAYRSNFRIDGSGRPVEVAGVPPDYFSETGQLWGNPVYDWKYMKKDGFSFWMARLNRASELYSILRIDHFRGFASYYAVPSDAPDAREGEWKKAEGRKLFDMVKASGLNTEIIAEDLGFITRDVKLLLTHTGFAGMQVLQFAFDGNVKNPHLNKRWSGDIRTLKNKVAYTGTHDNPPLAAWWDEADEDTRKRAEKYARGREMPMGLVKALAESDARYVIIPAQDVLTLGQNARLNTPGTPSGNWTWRLKEELSEPLAEGIKRLFD